MFPNAGSWIAQYDFFSFAWGIFLFFWIFQTVFLIKCYLVVYRLTGYVGYLFTFCSFFTFLVNTALILKVKTKNVNITKGVSLFSFSRNFSFLWCFAKIFWWFFFYSLGFSGDSCYKLLVDDFVQVLTFLWSFVFLKTKQVCQTETSMVGWSHWSWCQQMDI